MRPHHQKNLKGLRFQNRMWPPVADQVEGRTWDKVRFKCECEVAQALRGRVLFPVKARIYLEVNA